MRARVIVEGWRRAAARSKTEFRRGRLGLVSAARWSASHTNAVLLMAAVALLVFATCEVVIWQHGSHLALAIAGAVWGAALLYVVWSEG